MKIPEYQAKEFFASYGIPVPMGKVASSVTEAVNIGQEIGLPVVIKAQVLVGGRGKAGGIKIVENSQDLKSSCESVFNLTIKGIPVKKVLITKAIKIDTEYYLGITIDRSRRKPVLMASAAGGIEIEEIARKSPEKIKILEIEPLLGLQPFQVRKIGFELYSDSNLANEFTPIALKLSKLFFEKDCSLAEINPLALTFEKKLIAIDAKIIFDDSGLFRHPELAQQRETEIGDTTATELEAQKAGLSYVKLDGQVGCVVNGAGLAMATMDLIKEFGGEPANFLDIGGSSSPEKMKTAMKIILSDKNVKAILINIFGGITRCDDVAQGLILAAQEMKIDRPIVARLTGTNEVQALEILKDSPIIPTKTMAEATRKAVELAHNKI